ncbi:LOW QUALITY PROTEIN: origin recognition complex subunit 5 [Lepeophtheirus salmonis]|uniref:LOW QUALITY PROTEIN: origin recognition complex subunit 5 n=1 Tax=Lepeophtheirus salmonis TaxID=72036 RepID=UPI001AE24AEA|nr:LOW QUALITY PROTEIN: origin recognition complex subunit 5-like [Lepeophtheirus salmonis]
MPILCREEESEILQRLCAGDEKGFPSSVYLWGSASSGKTLLAKQEVGIKSYSSCVQSSVSMGLIYRDLLTPWDKSHIENFGDFVKTLNSLQIPSQERIVFALDSADRLRSTDPKTLSGFLRIREMTDLNICVLFISQIPPHRILGRIDTTLFPLHLPQYTKEQTIKILSHEVESAMSGYPSTFYYGYANILVASFFSVTRNVKELLGLAFDHFNTYKEPVDDKSIGATSMRALFRAFEPKLKALGENVLYRESGGEVVSMKERLKVELPFFSKFLLIAAYLSSHNPSKSDKRFFVKHHGKQRKTKAMIKAKQRYSSQLTGPKAFPIDRLLAIFYAIVEDRASPSANILSQISTLVTLQYLVQVGGDLDMPKYKCVAGLDFIRNLSRTVNFDIVKYLYDYA